MDIIGITSLQKLINVVIEFSVTYSLQIFGAVIILAVGLFISKWASRVIIKICEKKKIDITLSKFLRNILQVIIIAFAAVISLGKFGITIAPFVAAFGAVALGASLALQGLFANFAAGVVIIVTRPFVVGDTISVQGYTGIVEDVYLSITILSTEDKEKITIPNKHILGEILVNSFQYRIVESSVGISYHDDPENVINLIQQTILKHSMIPKTPSAQVGIEKFGDSSIDIGLRYWVPTEQYYETMYKINDAIYKTLQENKITIPFPQRDVHILTSSPL